MSFGVAKYCKQLGVDAAHPEYFLISHKEIMELHNLGIKVNPWTVNEREDIIKLTIIPIRIYTITTSIVPINFLGHLNFTIK
jgi:glycerophosphoryl diester phosphodiesterase